MSASLRYPVFKEITYGDPFLILKGLYSKFSLNLLFLDSNPSFQSIFPTGRYSYIAFDPSKKIRTRDQKTFVNEKQVSQSPFDCLSELYEHSVSFKPIPDLPPFQGGFAGYFGYELLHTLERVPFTNPNTHQKEMDDMRIHLYDIVIAFDHILQKAWVISTHETDAQNRLSWALDQLENLPFTKETETIAPPFDTLECDFTKDEFEKVIQKTIDYIYAGDIFQANITRRLYGNFKKSIDLLDLYQRLRQINPAPFSGAFFYPTDPQKDPHTPFGLSAILSSSPERFIQIKYPNQIETRPIKGTRKKSHDPLEDAHIQQHLKTSIKDQAENLMIVDLMRNDLSRVCKPFTVKTPVLCEIESYETVHHLVSVITGEMREAINPFDVIQATFPGGSISGAPKVRALEIISELEKAKRGPYCGCLGYIGLDGSMDLNILIRTLVVQENQVSFHVGGGIVADSDPLDEYEETCVKAKALVQTLTGKEFL